MSASVAMVGDKSKCKSPNILESIVRGGTVLPEFQRGYVCSHKQVRDALFASLADVSPAQFEQRLRSAKKLINYILNLFASRLGLDHNRMLGGRYALPTISRYLVIRDSQVTNAAKRDKLLYQYIRALCWFHRRYPQP